MTIDPEVETLPHFEVLYNLPTDTNLIVCIGGRGGSKTYEVSKFIAFSATIKKKRCVILRDEKALIKESILNEVWTRYDTANENGVLDLYYSKLDTELKDKRTGQALIYTKGFRASDNQKRANLKGPSDIDLAVIEEAEDIRDQEKYNTFVDGLRKQGCIVIILMNTPDIGHFLVKRLFNLEQVEDGYYKLIPKEIPGFVCIQTSYKDNPYLPAHIISNYEGYGDPAHHLYNKHYYLTAILGLASTGRKGQILTKVKPIKIKDYLALPFREFYGQDFGTASPAALVGVKFDKNNCYCRLINYEPKSTLDIGRLYCTLRFNHADKIIADAADEQAIRKLKGGFKELSADDYRKYPGLANGFFVEACTKGIGSVNDGLSIMIGMSLYAVEEDTSLWEEINNYVYAQDKYKNYTDDPIDDYNHAIDAWRYVVVDQRGKNKMFGI